MSLSDNLRLQFHQWLLDNELESEVADAILGSMSPFDWHELSTKTDLAELRADMATKTDLADLSANLRADMATKTDLADLKGEMTTGFGEIKHEIRDLRRLMHTVILGMVGFMLSVVLSVLAAAIAVGVV